MYVKANYNIKVKIFFLVYFYSSELRLVCSILWDCMCLYREVDVKQLSMNGDLEAKERYKLFSHLRRCLYFWAIFYLVNYL